MADNNSERLNVSWKSVGIGASIAALGSLTLAEGFRPRQLRVAKSLQRSNANY